MSYARKGGLLPQVKAPVLRSFNHFHQDFSLHFVEPSPSLWDGVFAPGSDVHASFGAQIRGGRHTSCARSSSPSPDLALVDRVLGTRTVSWCLPRRLPDALLCGESLGPPLTMGTSVPRLHPQDVAAWCPGACMCLRGEHRGLLLSILKMQSKHLLRLMLSYCFPGAVTHGAGRG